MGKRLYEDRIREERRLRVKQLREDRGFSQNEVADDLGAERSTYRSAENGYNSISIQMIEKIHKKWGVSADYILFGEEYSSEDILGMLRSTSKETRFEVAIRLLTVLAQNDLPDALDKDFDFMNIIYMMDRGRD